MLRDWKKTAELALSGPRAELVLGAPRAKLALDAPRAKLALDAPGASPYGCGNTGIGIFETRGILGRLSRISIKTP